MKNKLAVVRLMLYVILLAGFALLPVASAESGSICVYYRLFGALCPGCGVTRAFTNIMHFDFARAVAYNPVFTLAIAPISLLVFFEDAGVTIYRLVKKKDATSWLEYVWTLLSAPWPLKKGGS